MKTKRVNPKKAAGSDREGAGRPSAADRLNAALPPIEPGQRVPVLFVGNGINRIYCSDGNAGGPSWTDLILELEDQNGTSADHPYIDKLPATMQIIAAVNGSVHEHLKFIADITDVSEGMDPSTLRGAVWARAAKLPIDQVITTNYGYELERCLVREYTVGRSRKYTYHTGADTKSLRAVLLNRFAKLPCGDGEKHIWHIHGQSYKPSSIVIDQYEYGKLVSYVLGSMEERIGGIKAAATAKRAFNPKSWVEYFLTGDVYMLGFGMDPSEFDVWWLARCKAKNFPGTHIYLFDNHIPPERRLLFRACGVEHMDFGNMEDLDYYNKALDTIEKML